MRRLRFSSEARAVRKREQGRKRSAASRERHRPVRTEEELWAEYEKYYLTPRGCRLTETDKLTMKGSSVEKLVLATWGYRYITAGTNPEDIRKVLDLRPFQLRLFREAVKGVEDDLVVQIFPKSPQNVDLEQSKLDDEFARLKKAIARAKVWYGPISEAKVALAKAWYKRRLARQRKARERANKKYGPESVWDHFDRLAKPSK
jgi:hypothetical protein